MSKKKRKFWNWHGIQYYKFIEYLDLLPYIHLTTNSGFICFGWLYVTLSFFILPKLKRHHKVYTLIDKKLYLIFSLNEFTTPRIMIHEDTINILFAWFTIEYEREI